MEWKGKWIGPAQSMGDVCPVFVREFNKDINIEYSQ